MEPSNQQPELNLDFRLQSKTIGEFLAEAIKIENGSDNKSIKLDDYVNKLEIEMKKIDAFKRELPLSMMLLTNAVSLLKEEVKLNVEPVLEQFIPLKNCGYEGDERCKEKDVVVVDVDCGDKKDWVSSFQLWSSDNKPKLGLDDNKKKTEEKMDNSSQIGKNRGVGRAFLPFKRSENFPATIVGKKRKDEFPGAAGLSLAPPQIKDCGEDISSVTKSDSGRLRICSAANEQSNSKSGQQQNARKQRRCWSPELHRRFINSLQQLGGAQAATPKQIRDLMQVDGLTNDEVKSHLQKYRLHSRRVPPTTNTSAIQPQAMGTSWRSQEQCGESSKQSNSKSDSPHGPLHLPGSSRCTSMTGGDGMEDEDDEKSESHSWKSHVHLPRSGHS